MEELRARHRKELRDLQARITQKKKSATKKTRKGVNDECAALERELSEKHETELAQLESPSRDPLEANTNGDIFESEDVALTSSLNDLQIEAPVQEQLAGHDDHSESNSTTNSKKPSRQKARLARRAAELEAQAARTAEEASNIPDLRTQEKTAMQEQFSKHNLSEREIRPDGHCLYSAVATQLKDVGVELWPDVSALISSDENPRGLNEGYRAVRATTAQYIESHADDFSPFLEEPFDAYVTKVKETAEWGGELELRAIARAYGVDVNILQASGRLERIESGQGNGDKQIWLAYYRHYFGLGEHYNALRSRGLK